MKKFLSTLAMVGLAFASAMNCYLFVFPGRFAPAGVDGVCTMIGDVLNINMGYFSLMANVPLIICALLFLNRDFAIKSTVFVLSFGLSVILMKQVDFSAYHLPVGVFPPIAGGVVRGMLYFLTCAAITGNLHQKATIIDAHGAYSGDDTKMVLCVVKKKDVPYVEELIKQEACVTFKSPVSDSIAGVTYL